MKNLHRNLRKAAVLVASLSDRNAAALLDQMTNEQVDAVRQEIARLGPLDPDEQHEVIEEFFRIGPLVPDKQPSGLELDDRLASHLSSAPRCARAPESFTNASPRRLLHDAPANRLAPLLERERPQTVAMVLSRLPAGRAAEILAGLSGAMQTEVARRLVDLDDADPEVLGEVERAIESRLGQQLRGEERRLAGLTTLNNILAAATPRAKEHLLTNLARHDRPLAAMLDAPAGEELSFAELEQWDDASLASVVQHAPREILLLALAGARVEFARRVLDVLEPKEAGTLSASLRDLGPIRLSDVEEAQLELAELARQLEMRGEVKLALKWRDHLSVAV